MRMKYSFIPNHIFIIYLPLHIKAWSFHLQSMSYILKSFLNSSEKFTRLLFTDLMAW